MLCCQHLCFLCFWYNGYRFTPTSYIIVYCLIPRDRAMPMTLASNRKGLIFCVVKDKIVTLWHLVLVDVVEA